MEKVLSEIIKDWICWEIGGYENSYLDEGDEFEYKNLSKQDFVNRIYRILMTGKECYIYSPVKDYILEKKHIKFLGKQYLMDLIEKLVEKDYRKNGWKFPNNYCGK